jgi:hypothetical protein
MITYKKLLAFFVFTLLFLQVNSASAMTPSLSVYTDSTNNSVVQINVVGDANSNVLLKFFSNNTSGPQLKALGTTNSSGSFNLSMGLNDLNITSNSAVGVLVNNQASTDVAWPYSSSNTSSTNLTLSQSSLVLNTTQVATVTSSNSGSNSLYLSSNSSPQVANISFSGNQISVTGLSAGQTTANICMVNSSASQACSSLYIVVQSNSSQTLSFSQNNTSIISGQNVVINITGGNGFYAIKNNSNPTAISTSLNGPALTLYANSTTGSSTIVVCTVDTTSCGVVNASIGTYTSNGTGLSFSTSYPSVTTGQTTTINISGGYGTYYVSSNSNSSVAQTYISTSTLTIYGNNPGTTSITVCAPSGHCGIITTTVIAASGGILALSQNNVTISAGQLISVNISGGTVPYSIIQPNDGIAQYSLNNSAISVTGIKSGTSQATVCSSAGGCITLTVIVSSSGNTVSGVQPSFSQNNVSINTNQTTSILMTGNGGYYISNNSNQNILAASVSGNSLVLTGVAIGSANINVCQTGGQCNVLYVTVSNSATSNATVIPITFDKQSITLKPGDASSAVVSGGSGSGYYISYNSKSDVVGVYILGNTLIIAGKAIGSGTISVCSSANACASISVSVQGGNQSSNNSKYKFTKPLKFGLTNTEVTELQKRLTEEGIYSGPITGYYGSLTVAAVKKYQKKVGLEQLGSVGPGTRAALNK